MPEAAVGLDGLVRAAVRSLADAGIPEPVRVARRIWSDLREIQPSHPMLWSDEVVEPAEQARFEACVARVAAGEPLAYATGIAGFRRLTLHCDRRALIPRPETEGLVELVLDRVAGGRVADLGTGSGCIALSLADEGRFDLVLGVDRSAEALGLAAKNCDRLGLPVTLVQGDLTGPLGGSLWDAVVSNPPYLTAAEYASLDPSVRTWEPELALGSGPDGMEHTARLIVDGLRVVRPGGWLALEVDCSRATSAAEMAAATGWIDSSIYDDLFGRARYLLARRSEMA